MLLILIIIIIMIINCSYPTPSGVPAPPTEVSALSTEVSAPPTEVSAPRAKRSQQRESTEFVFNAFEPEIGGNWSQLVATSETLRP